MDKQTAIGNGLCCPSGFYNRVGKPTRLTSIWVNHHGPFTVAALLMIACAAVDCSAWRNFSVQMTNVTVKYDRKWLDVSCSIRRATNDTLLEVHLTVLKDIQLAWAHTTVVFVSPQMDESLELMNSTVNLCQFMSVQRRDPIYRKLMDQISHAGVVFDSCPVRANYYFLNDFRIDEDLFPPYTPDTFFEVRTRVHLKKESPEQSQIIDAILSGRIDKTKGIENFMAFSKTKTI